MGKSNPLSAQVPKRSSVPWLSFTDQGNFYKIAFPSTWQVLHKANQVIFASPTDLMEARAILGITPEPEGTTIDEAVADEFAAKDRSPDMQKIPTRLADAVGIKVTRSKKGDPRIRVIEYYVQKGYNQYYILLQAPKDAWAQYEPAFDAMIRSLKFLK